MKRGQSRHYYEAGLKRWLTKLVRAAHEVKQHQEAAERARLREQRNAKRVQRARKQTLPEPKPTRQGEIAALSQRLLAQEMGRFIKPEGAENQ